MLLVLVSAACGGDETASLSGPAGTAGGGEPPTLAGPATTTTAPPAVLPSVLPPTTGRPAAGSTAATAAQSGGGATTVAPSRAALTPATPGTYRYDTTGSSRVGALVSTFPAVTTLVVDPPAGSTQHSTRNLRDAAGGGPLFESTFDYRSDGVYLVSLKLTATVLVVTQAAELRPPSPVLFLPKDAAPGYHREMDIPTSTGQGTAHLVLDVRRAERVTVGGQGVDTLVVQLVTALGGQIGGQVDITVWLAPANRLWVKERFVANAATPDGALQYHSEYDATLQSLR
ncbi:MAG: hypothetical protein ACRD2W_01970 [Acidimicrobiales bacterium]